MGMGFAPTWLRQVNSPLLHMTILTSELHIKYSDTIRRCWRVLWLLPRDAVCKRGLHCDLVSVHLSVRPYVSTYVRLSVRLSRWCILSRWLKISSNFFVGPVAPSF